MNGYLSAMRRYAGFQGRASRAEFWQFTVVMTVVVIVALIIDAALISGPDSTAHPLAGLVVLAHILPSLAVSVRRLHDTDRSGFFLFINLIPLIGVVLLLVWACEAGTAGANGFGPDPRGGSPQPVHGQPMASGQPARRDVIGEVERLSQLKANGSLTDAEYEAMKAQALGRG